MSDNDYEEDEEMILVNLNALIDNKILDHATFKDFKVIGLDTDKPLMLLENHLFSGTCEGVRTTACFFEKNDETFPTYEDPPFSQKCYSAVRLACKARTAFEMVPAFAMKKKANTNERSSENEIQLENQQVEDFKEIDWKDEEFPPEVQQSVSDT